VQEDPAYLFVWCDEYTLLCILRGCLLAEMALSPTTSQKQNQDEMQIGLRGSSTGDSTSVEQFDGLGSCVGVQRTAAEISTTLQNILSLGSQHPVVQRSVEQILNLLAQLT
jgi:hypothetical protein